MIGYLVIINSPQRSMMITGIIYPGKIYLTVKLTNNATKLPTALHCKELFHIFSAHTAHFQRSNPL